MDSISPIRLSDYLEYNWWHKWLGENFPEYHGSADPTWKVSNLVDSHRYPYLWYKSDVAIIGYQHYYRKRPAFMVYVPETGYQYRRVFNMEEAEEDLLIIEAIAKPKLLPLCINTWAGDLMTDYFKRIQG